MILSEGALLEWCVGGPQSTFIDAQLDGCSVAAPDVMSVLMRVELPGNQRRQLLEDLRSLGVEIKPIGVAHVRSIVSRERAVSSNAGGIDWMGIRFALALAAQTSEDVAVVTGEALARVRVTDMDIVVLAWAEGNQPATV